ncbi:uncharacterized protein LOC144207007 [Stigmatopora nigra]
MMTFKINVIFLLAAFFAASTVHSEDILPRIIKIIKDEAIKASRLQLQGVMVQRPKHTTCRKLFFCEAEKALKNSTHVEKLLKVVHHLHQYNVKTGVSTCHLRKNEKSSLYALLNDIEKCSKLILSH